MHIPLVFEVAPKWPSLMDEPSIHYDAELYKSGSGRKPQSLLQNRLVLKPKLDLNRYKCKAVIDWIEVRLETDGRHQAVNMQRAFSKMLTALDSSSTVYVSGPSRQQRYIGRDFIVRIQQPLPQELAPFLKSVVAKYSPGETAIANMKVAGLEISVDFFVTGGVEVGQEAQDLMRWQMTDTLRRLLKPQAVLTENDKCDPRFYFAQKGIESAAFLVKRTRTKLSGKAFSEKARLGISSRDMASLYLGSHNTPPVDLTSYIGGKRFPVLLRTMDKTTDRRDPTKGEVDDLPSCQRRSRVEVTLKEDRGAYDGPGAINLAVLGDLYGYQFQEIRKTLFEFFLPTFGQPLESGSLPFPITANERAVFERSGVYGLDRFHRAIEMIGTKQYSNREIAAKPERLGSKGRLGRR